MGVIAVVIFVLICLAIVEQSETEIYNKAPDPYRRDRWLAGEEMEVE